MFSYWEQESFGHYHHIVVGSGIVGLSHAIELSEHYVDARILVLERALLPTGASTRNAGFACMGSATELLDDLTNTSEADVVALFAQRKEGLELLRNRLGDERIGYRANGSYELISEAELYAIDQLDYLNRLLQPVTGKPAFEEAKGLQATFGFGEASVSTMVRQTCEGELHTGKMMRALIDMAIHKGIEIKTGANVVRYDEEELRVVVTVEELYRKEEWRLTCDTLSICTNAFTKSLLPTEDIVPGRGQVLMTEPVEGLKFKGIFHFDKGYYYFREIDGRVLFGGGRNLDFDTEQTTEIALNQIIQDDLDHKLANVILPGMQVKVAQRWAGIMAFGSTKQPIVKAISARVFGAYRMGGMGVALGSSVAATLAHIIKQRW